MAKSYLANGDTYENLASLISKVPSDPKTLCPSGINFKKLGLGVGLDST